MYILNCSRVVVIIQTFRKKRIKHIIAKKKKRKSKDVYNSILRLSCIMYLEFK